MQIIGVLLGMSLLASSQQANAAKFAWECSCLQGQTQNLEKIQVSGVNLNCKREVSGEDFQVKNENAKLYVPSSGISQIENSQNSASFEVGSMNNYKIEKFEDLVAKTATDVYYSYDEVSALLEKSVESYKNTSFKLSLTKCEKDTYDKITGSPNCTNNGKKYEGTVVFTVVPTETSNTNDVVAVCLSNER